MNRSSLSLLTLAFALAACHREVPAQPHTWSSGSVATSADDRQLLVADADHRALFMLDRGTGALATKVALGAVPAEVLAVESGAYVTLRSSGEVAFIDTAGALTTRKSVGEEPIGLARSPDGRLLYVANMTSRTLSVLDATTLERVRPDIAVGTAPRSVAAPGDGLVYVGDFLSGRVHVIDPAAGTVLREIALDVPADTTCGGGDERSPSLVAALAVAPDGQRVYAAHVQSRLDILPIGEPRMNAAGSPLAQAVAPAVGTIDLASQAMLMDPGDQWNCADATCERPDRPPTLLVTDCGPPPGMDAPSALVIDPSGQWLFVTDHNSNAVAVIGARGQTGAGFAFPERSLHDVLRVGARPTGLALSRDQRFLYVHAAFDHAIDVVATGSAGLSVARRYTYADSTLALAADRGRRLFYSAVDPRMTEPTMGGVSCSSCHPDGRTDGLTWAVTSRDDNGGTTLRRRNTPALWNMSASGLSHWAGVAQSLPAFMDRMVETMGGTGVDARDVSDIEAYLATLEPPAAPAIEPTDTLTAMGRTLFDGKAGCATCHAGPLMTDQVQRLAGDADLVVTPSLRGLRATPPYLHDGTAATVRAVLAGRASLSAHQVEGKLSAPEFDALVRFVEQR